MKKGVYFAYLLIGIAILVILIASYFIPITLTEYSNQGVLVLVNDTLLGIIIFHKLPILFIYVLIGLLFIYLSLKKINIRIK